MMKKINLVTDQNMQKNYKNMTIKVYLYMQKKKQRMDLMGKNVLQSLLMSFTHFFQWPSVLGDML